ncbi:MAG: hypothetical protein V4584_09265 [Verrucomicrobiota bacterium]
MRNSEAGVWLTLILSCGSLGVLRADDLTLTDDARLTGVVRSINEAGVLELASALSPAPLLLKPGAVTKVEFSAPASESETPSVLIELTNGDVLPATVESLDDKTLNIGTTDAGRLTIPRAALKSMQFGVHKRKVVYTGPKNLTEWAHDGEGAKNWTFANKSLAANGPAYASKHFEVPRQFVLKFTLKWQANPSFRIYFADPLDSNADEVDRYYMQFNGAGLEIKRESTKGQHFQSVILSPRTPDEFPENRVDVEIRVDRKTSRIHLFLDGEPDAAGVDPVPEPPEGNGVTLVNSSPAGSTQEIRSIEIHEFDNSRARHRSENRGDPKTDSLISSDDERWGGSLTRIQKGADGAVFSFKSDFQEEPLELLEKDVSTIFFAQPDQKAAPASDHPFSLHLRDDGRLSVSSCVFAEDSIITRHPLLGDLKINRTGISALERTGSPPAAKKEE